MSERILQTNEVRAMGMFSFEGDRIVNGIANSFRRRFVQGHPITAEQVQGCLDRLGQIEGYEEATDTVVAEILFAYIQEGDKLVEGVDWTHEHCCNVVPSTSEMVWYPWTKTASSYEEEDFETKVCNNAGQACYAK